MKPLWEQEDFQRVAGEIWRPGGPELTRRALELAARRCGLAPGARLLDLGCGPGASLELLAGLGYLPLGLDRRTHAAWAKRAAGAERSPAVIFLQGDAACPPLADNSVDGVLSECVLSLLPDPLDALRGCRRTLRPGGALLLSDLFRHGDMLEEGGASLAPPESGCLAGARSRAVWEGLLVRAGFVPRCFEDHSRALVEMAARLLWYGADAAPEWLRGGCACGGRRGAVGYGLWIAQKEGS